MLNTHPRLVSAPRTAVAARTVGIRTSILEIRTDSAVKKRPAERRYCDINSASRRLRCFTLRCSSHYFVVVHKDPRACQSTKY